MYSQLHFRGTCMRYSRFYGVSLLGFSCSLELTQKEFSFPNLATFGMAVLVSHTDDHPNQGFIFQF
jgi:hypothetical protein